MVVKEDGHMVTARQEPRLVLVSITLENNYLTLEAPGMEQIVLPIKLPSSNKIHNCRCSACGPWGDCHGADFSLHLLQFMSEPQLMKSVQDNTEEG
jgi:hypothetical protein